MTRTSDTVHELPPIDLGLLHTTAQAADQQQLIQEAEATVFGVRSLETFAIRKVEWLDKPFFQRAAFHLLAGRKGTCKGTFICGLSARVTTGALYGVAKRVLVVTSEDSVELDFLPRFVAAGRDPSMVKIIHNGFRLPDQCEWLEETARIFGDVGLIVT